MADAHLVAEKLVERCGYDPQRILLIADDQPKAHLRPLKINLQGQVQKWLMHAEPGDTVLVFFAGHGYIDDDRQHFLAPQDCRRDHLGLTGLRTTELREMLRQCKATQKVLVLDCCHAGGKRELPVGPSSQELGASFRAAKGLITLASCSERETSSEWEAKGHGLFTYFLAEGLAGSADGNKDGLVDSDELYAYTLDQVTQVGQRDLNAAQTPVRIIGEDVVGRFLLARIAPSGRIRVNDPKGAAGKEPVRPDLAAGGTGGEPLKTITNSIGMKLVLIPAGEFLMGSPDSDPSTKDDEQPRHLVRISKPFYLGIYEVTQGQYRAISGQNPSAAKGKGSDDLPVERVSWVDAIEFCNKLSEREKRTPYYRIDGPKVTIVSGTGYRLPTEAEWEYACRAGSATIYPFGDDASMLKDHTWYQKTPRKSLIASARNRRTRGEFTICWETCGNGATIGSTNRLTQRHPD